MKSQKKVIITCAITGAAHTPSMSPYLPITPEHIAAEAIAAAEAGASMIHLHARNPENGFPTTDPDIYGQFLPVIKNNCNAIINITTGQPSLRAIQHQRPDWAYEDRMAAPLKFSPEVTSFNMGPLNLGLWAMKDKFKGKFKYDWEREMFNMKGVTIQNTFEMMENIAKDLGQDRGVRFEYECFDIGHLHTLKLIADQGWVKPPFFIQSVLGFAGGLPATYQNVAIMKQTADDLFGDDYNWSVLPAGKAQIPLSSMTAVMGGNVRVGLEDSLWLSKGELAKSNADQVKKIRRILEELSLEIATPDEAREIIGTKGPDNVNF